MIRERFIKDLIEKPIKQYWDLPSFTDIGGKTYKYSDVARMILANHRLYRQLGIKKGDKVALIGKNSSLWTINYLSVVTYGAVIVPILPDFHPREMHNIVNHSDAVLLFVSKKIIENLDLKQMPNLKAVVVYDYTAEELNEGKKNLEILEQTVSVEFPDNYPGEYLKQYENLTPDEFEVEDIPNSELVEIMYTSGSTGNSKGVMLHANSLAVNVVYGNNHLPPLKPGDIIVSILPLAHSFGCAFEFLYPFNRGVHVHFLMKKPSPQVLMQTYAKYRPNLIFSVPLVYEKIYKNVVLPKISKQPYKTLLKIPVISGLIKKKIRQSLIDALGGRFAEVVLGGAPLNEEVERFYRSIKFPITLAYGMTECGPVISYAPWKENKFRASGKLIEYLEAKLVPQPEAGGLKEIWVRGENVMLGYYKNPEATAKVLDDEGWLHTGDLGEIDDEGYVFIKGRSKSLLLGPSGENIFPEEIEALYLKYAYVEEVLVVMRDTRLVALIYPNTEELEKDGVKPEEYAQIFDKIRKEVNNLLPHFKQVSKIELRDEPFEKTPKRNIRRFLYS